MEKKLFGVEKVRLYPGSPQNENGITRLQTQSYGTFRLDNGLWLGTVGSGYQYTQPNEIYDNMQKVLNELDPTKKVQVREYRGGKKLSFEIRLDNFEVNTKRKVGDTVAKKLRFITSYDGSVSNTFQYFIVRLACSNGMTTNKLINKLRFRHTEKQERMFKELFNNITFAMKQQRILEEYYNNIADETYIPGRDNKAFLNKLLGFNINEEDLSTRKINQWNALEELLYQYTNDLGRNKWAALQSVTHYTNHITKRDDQNYYLTFGNGATLNKRAEKILVGV